MITQNAFTYNFEIEYAKTLYGFSRRIHMIRWGTLDA